MRRPGYKPEISLEVVSKKDAEKDKPPSFKDLIAERTLARWARRGPKSGMPDAVRRKLGERGLLDIGGMIEDAEDDGVE